MAATPPEIQDWLQIQPGVLQVQVVYCGELLTGMVYTREHAPAPSLTVRSAAGMPRALGPAGPSGNLLGSGVPSSRQPQSRPGSSARPSGAPRYGRGGAAGIMRGG